jgi:hypothetical protein
MRENSADCGSNQRVKAKISENGIALSQPQKVLIGLEAMVSLCGIGGGTYMATHPLTTMSLHYLRGTWFHTWRWPGLALIFFVGVCPALAIMSTILHRREASVGHCALAWAWSPGWP